MTTYKVTCSNCGGSSEVRIDQMDRVDWEKSKVDKVISARKRLDQQWGFQCFCGNNDLMSQQEKDVIADYANPQAQEIHQIIDNLKLDKPKFEMVAL